MSVSGGSVSGGSVLANWLDRLNNTANGSLSGAKWQAARPGGAQTHLSEADKERQAKRLAQHYGMPLALARHMAGYGVFIEEADSYLAPSLRQLMPDPSLFADMDKMAGILAEAVQARQTIGLFGDYDVDGACSAALMAHVLRALGCNVEVHIPDRFTEGYGPNLDALKSLKTKGCDLILTLDCGISAHEPLAAAAELGMRILVVDHHLAGPVLPAALAVVNPNRLDDQSGQGMLCAAGVCFMVLVALMRVLRQNGDKGLPDLMAHLDLVALATICDVVPLTGLNRAFVRQGLAVMGKGAKPGIVALQHVAKANAMPDAYQLGFQLGPRINAAGRLGQSDLGVQLLTADNPQDAGALALRLDEMNKERQETERAVLSLAEDQIAGLVAAREKAGKRQMSCLISHGTGWHEGVLGIVAGRIKERYHQPAMALSFDETGRGKGSARSVAGIPLGQLIMRAVSDGLIEGGGGHDMAAGLSLHHSQLPAFQAFMDEQIAMLYQDPPQKSFTATDCVSIAALEAGFVEWMDRLAPFGTGHAEPRFILLNCVIKSPRWIGTDGTHFSCSLDDGTAAPLRAIGFRLADNKPLADALDRLKQIGPVAVLGRVRRDDWRGHGAIQFQIEDIAPSV